MSSPPFNTTHIYTVAGTYDVEMHAWFVTVDSADTQTITVGASVCNAAPVDVNCDGVVDIFDVVLVVQTAFREVPPPDPCCLEP